jgi:CheY-like chemotaxis protein/DNA-directed RNA polymerase specialized sigma24 family protein
MKTTIADLVAPQLPRLRRFARALTGSQKRGDCYVAATLEAIIADSRVFRRDLAPRTALYQLFLRVWNALPLNRSGAPDSGIARHRIEMLTLGPRLAFLLIVLEQFGLRDAAAVLEVSELEAQRLMEAAHGEIARQIFAMVLIIEDDPLVAVDIENIVCSLGHEVAGIAETSAEAIALARRTPPGIVLADIQLADGSSGIDAVNGILVENDVPAIFITAYPELLLTGDCAEPVCVINKPFMPEILKAAISQALFFGMRTGGSHRGAAA